jgi:hypothetical protein
MITDEMKLRCLKRELALRRNVYAKRVRGGQMPEHEALYEITVIQAIAADYQAKLGTPEREKEKDNGNRSSTTAGEQCGDAGTEKPF